jgi:hypothetical protein
MKASRKRYWVGCKAGDWQVFQSAESPTEESHGHLYGAVIGPFPTARGACFMAWHGPNNPHCVSVAQAEQLGKECFA